MCAEVGRRTPCAGDISGKNINFGSFLQFLEYFVYTIVSFGFLLQIIHESGIQDISPR